MSEYPDFYTGAPVDTADLRFRDEFLAELWDTLKSNHVLVAAPRRTGKTSVMDHLRDYPKNNFKVISVNVQDLTHPADLFLLILDAFQDHHPDYVRDILAKGWKLLTRSLNKIREVEFEGFKIALRDSDPDWRDNWRQHGDRLLKQIRARKQRVLLVVDELPDMLLNLRDEDASLLREFLAWWRIQRLTPHPKDDAVRWLIGGSVNLTGTLDSMGCVDLVNDLENVPLPPLTEAQVSAFVDEMLTCRGVAFEKAVPERIVVKLGRPIPLFMQLVTLDLYRRWKRHHREAGLQLTTEDVDQVFNDLVRSSAAQDKLQHYYSRIRKYYTEPRLSAAYELLAKLSLTPDGISREVLSQEFDRIVQETGLQLPTHERKKHFNQLLKDLENDFYVEEVSENLYDFASGVLKSWWRKYYA